ncbi:MAG: amidohydrolase family protein [Candidatus Hydrogenedentes bacterium]|nr:amidohydrolase family protein [Candidatus Hydrogenedentota bacterium]
MSRGKDEFTVRGVLLGESWASDVVVRAGKVVKVKRMGGGGADVGSTDTIIAPTLFDIQVNGYGGVDLQGSKVTTADVRKVADLLAAQGVSHWIPTLITGSQDEMEHGCRVLAEARQDRTVARAIPGIHLEGPYISPMDGPRGAHPKAHVRKPSVREFDRFMKAAGGRILYVTLAPEVPGAMAFIRALRKRGVVVSIGHHYADEKAIAKAVGAGAQLSTHLGNGMKAEIPRHVNPLWPQLAEDRLSASLIPDLEHLPRAALKTFVRVKGPARTILTSDVLHIAGLKPGKYDLMGQPVEMLRSGRVCLSGTELLAGSSLGLLQGVVNAACVTDLTIEQAFACASTIPARLFGLRHAFVSPKVGMTAEFVAFDVDKSASPWKATVRASFVGGRRMA